MVGKKIRAYREYKGMTQIDLAQKSNIHVTTIRKYELGERNPKPDQLEKIASALGLNVSLFLDLNIETVGDVLSLLFAIDDAVDLSLSKVYKDGNETDSVSITFNRHTLQNAIKSWCEFKEVYEAEERQILSIEDEQIRKAKLEQLENFQCQWKLQAMANTLGCHMVVKKGTEGVAVRVSDMI